MLRLLRHALIQLAAGALAWLWVAPLAAPAAWALLAAGFAFGFALVSRVPSPGRWLHLAFWPLASLALSAGLPPWVYLVALIVTVGLGRNALHERVPFYRSNQRVAERLAELLPQGATLLEAGCGDARLALALSRLRPDLVITGVENAWLAWSWAKWRWLCAGRPANVAIRFGSLWRERWGGYQAIYVFLSPAPMPRVWQQFRQDAAPGALLISNSFTVPGVPADQTLPLGGPLQQALYLWRHSHGAC
ncbi:SAM-dependent methyltransferase [Crenobacter cavernae]|uniref:SAM-dependent methyltransferase n=1 Tax=Crenobacter cavernae TaxID=2290923 RepID=A0ABY0FAS7_9NEIS|nr:SAM-dependent methyltransferase [Crenobacter cavernae]RXZ42766.1 SAM-dependent methyltransferase [Crenobacter cavernae]